MWTARKRFVRWIKDVSLALELGGIVAVTTLVPLFVGLWVDRDLHTTPVFTLAAVGVGLYLSVYSVRQRVRALDNHGEETENL